MKLKFFLTLMLGLLFITTNYANEQKQLNITDGQTIEMQSTQQIMCLDNAILTDNSTNQKKLYWFVANYKFYSRQPNMEDVKGISFTERIANYFNNTFKIVGFATGKMIEYFMIKQGLIKFAAPEEITIKDVQSAINEFKAAINEKATQKELLDLRSEIVKDFEKTAVKQEVIDELKTKLNALQTQTDDIGREWKNKQTPEQTMSFKQMIMQGLKSEEYKEYVKRGAKGTSAKIDIKLASDVTVASNFVNNVIPADVRTNPLLYVDRRMHLRDYMATGTTISDKIDYPKETAYTDGADMKLENIAATQSDFTITEATANVQTLDTYMAISRNMLDDTSWISSYLSQRVPIKLLNKEDQQCLFGNNTPPQLQGITTVASAFAAGASAGTITGAQEIDVLRVAMKQARIGEYQPTLVILNPSDLCNLDLIKDKNENYVRVELYSYRDGQPYFMNLPIFETNAMTAGEFLVGDFTLGTQLIDREGITMYVTDSHSDLFVRRMHTFLFEKRIALPIYNPGAFIYGTFSTAKAALDSGS